MKKKGLAAVLTVVILLGCAGCGKREAEPTPSVEPMETVTPTPMPTPTPEPSSVLEVYQQALKRLLEEHIDPDPEIGHYEDHVWETMGQIEFAVCDVDMDGGQELIMRHAHDITAGQYTAVYRYGAEKKELAEEACGTASCRFYDNGTMQVGDSHNQGWSGAFWPFAVLKYDEMALEYREIAYVAALDKELMDANELPGYPEEVDAEKAGFVYCVYGADETGIDWDAEVEWVSQSAYDAWYEELFSGAREIQVDYLPLTAANVGNLCYEGDIPPKVHVDINNEWYDWELRHELTERQLELLENLPAAELPKEAVEWRDTREVWENTLVPMCYDEKNDVTLYAVVTEDSILDFQNGGYLSGAGIVLRKGDKTYYHSICHDQFWTGGNPLMVVKDLNGDGKDEAAVSFLCGHGTGVSVSMLYIFDLEKPWLYDTVDFSMVDINVTYGEAAQTAILTSGEESLRVKVDMIDDWTGGVYAGNIVRYSEENGKLLCTLDLDFGGRTLGYLATATGEVIYENGRYTLGPLTLAEL